MKPESATAVVQANVSRILAENRAAGRAPSKPVELAAAMGTSEQNLSQMLKKKSMNLTSVERLAQGLRVNFWELVRPSDAPAGHSLQDCLREIGRAVADAEEVRRLRELAPKVLEKLAADFPAKKKGSGKAAP
jgi:transcriptional regulator with XRE-family HTH domain